MFRTILPQDLIDPYKLLVGTSAPRPIAWVSTMNEDGSNNLAPFSFSVVVSVNPMVLAICPITPKKGKLKKDTLANIENTGEFVFHVVTERIKDLANKTSVDIPYGQDESVYVPGIEMVDSHLVKPRRIINSPVAYECKLCRPLAGESITRFGLGPMSGTIIFGEVICVHIEENFLREDGSVDSQKLGLVGRVDGDNWSSLDLFPMPNERVPK